MACDGNIASHEPNAEQTMRLQGLPHVAPEDSSDSVLLGHCSELFQAASVNLEDEESTTLALLAFNQSLDIDFNQSLDVDCNQSLDIDFNQSLDVEDYDVPECTSDPPRPVLPRSEAIGVTYHKKNKQWEAHLWVKNRQLGKRKKKGTQIFLGNFQTQDEAKCAHDKAAMKLNVRETAKGKPYPLNFPETTQSTFMALHQDWSARDFVWKIRRFSHRFSKGKCAMKGVNVRSRKGRGTWYEAKISHTMDDGAKRTFDLGKFECEEVAGRAYDRALLFFKGVTSDCVTNFRPSAYSESEVQAAGMRLLTTME